MISKRPVVKPNKSDPGRPAERQAALQGRGNPISSPKDDRQDDGLSAALRHQSTFQAINGIHAGRQIDMRSRDEAA